MQGARATWAALHNACVGCVCHPGSRSDFWTIAPIMPVTMSIAKMLVATVWIRAHENALTEQGVGEAYVINAKMSLNGCLLFRFC